MVAKKKGFLLFELAVVLAIIFLLAGFGFALSGVVRRMAVRADVFKIAAILRYEWIRACACQKQITVSIDLKKNCLRDEQHTYSLSSDVVFGVLASAHGPPSRPVHALTTPSSFPDNKIIFFPDGTVTAGALYIRDCSRSTLYAITIPLPNIFYVRVYAYHARKWTLV